MKKNPKPLVPSSPFHGEYRGIIPFVFMVLVILRTNGAENQAPSVLNQPTESSTASVPARTCLTRFFDKIKNYYQKPVLTRVNSNSMAMQSKFAEMIKEDMPVTRSECGEVKESSEDLAVHTAKVKQVKNNLEQTMLLSRFHSMHHLWAMADFVKSVDESDYIIEKTEGLSILLREGIVAPGCNKVKEEIRQSFHACGGDEIRNLHKEFVGIGKLKNF
jgi:hypothetical protein